MVTEIVFTLIYVVIVGYINIPYIPKDICLKQIEFWDHDDYNDDIKITTDRQSATWL